MAQLTQELIEQTPLPTTGEIVLWDDLIPGFGVRIPPTGRRVFFLRYRMNNKRRRVMLGVYGEEMSLAQIRKRALTAVAQAKKGKDPAQTISHPLIWDTTLKDMQKRFMSELAIPPLRRRQKSPIDFTPPPVLQGLEDRLIFFDWASLITGPCVYFLCNAQEVLYVGQTENILTRFRAHLQKLSHVNITKAYVLPVPKAQVSAVELACIRALWPRWNSAIFYTKTTPVDMEILQSHGITFNGGNDVRSA